MRKNFILIVTLLIYSVVFITLAPKGFCDKTPPIPSPGTWQGEGIVFNVSSDGTRITSIDSPLKDNASIIITFKKAGIITFENGMFNTNVEMRYSLPLEIPIENGKFHYKMGVLEVKGKFRTESKASGTAIFFGPNGEKEFELFWKAVPDASAIDPDIKTQLDMVKKNPPLQILEGHSNKVIGMVLSQDGKHLVSCSKDRTINIWDLEKGAAIHRLTGHTGDITAVALTPDGQHIISSSTDKTIRVWDFKTGNLLRTLTGHHAEVSCIAVTPDGKRWISGDRNGIIKVWDATTASIVQTINTINKMSGVETILVTKDGNYIITSSGSDNVQKWDLTTGDMLKTYYANGIFASIIEWTHDKAHLAAVLRNEVRIWNCETGGITNCLVGHTGKITAITFTKDGTRVITAAQDHTLRIWDAQSGGRVKSIPIINMTRTITTTANNEQIIVGGSDGKIRFWSIN